ncbi:MAG: hypothetical protein HQK58_17550, partial [Deltaproteobacteria bacterium]|nr:hypothetical protein [Deltaproteobacteria bacterium]
MSLSIVNNLPAIGAYNALSGANKNLANAINHLSTGLRINGAKDDPSGLAISERFKGQISGLNQASMNAQDGTSMLQTADGALNEVQQILQRMRELAVQASNGTLTSQDRSSIQDEVDQLKAEVNQISTSTEFNTKKLLNGNLSGITSTDHPDQLQAYVTGQVREGNYRISVQASATGNNEVWKSDVMELAKPYTATQDNLKVQLNNTNGSMLASAGITVTQTKVPQDTAYYYQFQQGKAAELNGSAVGVGAITIAGTDASFAANKSEQHQMGATQQVAGVAQNCSTETVNFNQSTTFHFGANAVTFGKGTYNMTQITCAIETGGGGVKVLWTAGTTPNPAGGYFMTISSTAGVAISVTGDTGALNLANTTLAANTSVTAGQNTENSYLFFF